MSLYGIIYLEKLNTKTKKWELCSLYDKQEKDGEIQYEPVPLWEGQGIIKDILRDREIISDYSYRVIIDEDDDFYNLGEYLTDINHSYNKDIDGDYDLAPQMFAMTYGQILAYLNRKPKVYDIYADKKVPNPMKEIINRIDIIADMKNIWFFSHEELNEFRIIYWVE